MNNSFRYAYLLASIFFLIVWLIIFWRLKAFRRPMLIMSLIAASFGQISELWYFADYWKPGIVLPLPIIGGIEDMLFGFSQQLIPGWVEFGSFMENMKESCFSSMYP